LDGGTLILVKRFDVLTVVKVFMLVFWVVMPHGLVGRFQQSGGIYCLHILFESDGWTAVASHMMLW
jgi:hypothetical protein